MERKKQVGRDFSDVLMFCGNLLHCTESLPSEKWIQVDRCPVEYLSGWNVKCICSWRSLVFKVL